MRDHLLLAINGQPCQVERCDAFLSLSDYLRKRLRLIGSKIVCSEGDCGACTVLVGRKQSIDDAWHYRPIDACIAWMFQLDQAHVVTVEGVSDPGGLNCVQQAMVDCHGSQCGFCTPGFVVQMTALREQLAAPTADDLRRGLSGNLCRCTGYVPIFEAGQAAAAQREPTIAERYPAPLGHHSESIAAGGSVSDAIEIVADVGGQQHRLFCPTNLDETLTHLEQWPAATIIAGATDVGVQINKSHTLPETIIDLNRVDELRGVEIDDRRVVVGARATWSELMEAYRDEVPVFYEILSRFGSPQIRHAATIGGNLANASPIADSLPFFYVSEARVHLARRGATRTVAIADFYRGYKQLDMAPGELITRVEIPLPDANDRVRVYKISRRRDLDIASFTAAIRIRVTDGQITDAKVAYGAVGPTVIRARETEQFLIGRPFDEATFAEAGDVAVAEVSPISDVRGAEAYRLLLTRNILRKFYFEEAQPAPPRECSTHA